MKDSLGDRMKAYYEDRTRISLMRRQYTIIRVDGKAFHTYTKGLKRPFDDELMQDMDDTAKYLCKNIQGAKFAFVQSDEISILLTDFDEIDTSAWFDYNVQKMASVSSSLATVEFNRLRWKRAMKDAVMTWQNSKDGVMNAFDKIVGKAAAFDSRVFQVPTKIEVANYMLWRQQDTTRNSISSVAQSMYSHKELNGKNSNQMQELIFQKGTNWNEYDAKYKRGRIMTKETYALESGALRSRWVMVEPPVFSQEREFLNNLIPDNI